METQLASITASLEFLADAERECSEVRPVRTSLSVSINSIRGALTQTRDVTRTVLATKNELSFKPASKESTIALVATLRTQDYLVRVIHSFIDTVLRNLSSTMQTIDNAQTVVRDERAMTAKRLKEMVDSVALLERNRSTAWESHSQSLDSLYQCGNKYQEQAIASRVAQFSSTVGEVFSLLQMADRELESTCGVQMFTLLSGVLGGVLNFTQENTECITGLLAEETRHRERSRDAIVELRNASDAVSLAKSRVAGEDAKGKRLGNVLDELQQISAAVNTVNEFWTNLKDSVGSLSSSRYVDAIENTSGKENGTDLLQSTMAVELQHMMYFCGWSAIEKVMDKCLSDMEKTQQ